MLKVFFLILRPAKTWERTAEEQRGYVYILLTYLLPFIALDVFAQGWSLLKWGRWQSRFHLYHTYTQTPVIHFEILQALLLLAMVMISIGLIWVTTNSFQPRRKFLPVFSTVAYGFSPLFLMNLLNVMPDFNLIVIWAIGITLTVSVLYQGIPHGIKPDPTQAFGIYLTMIFIVVLVSAAVQVLPALYLMGWIDFSNSRLLQVFGHWLGE